MSLYTNYMVAVCILAHAGGCPAVTWSTFNKSQPEGKTMDRVLLDLRCGVFGHGQLYVGIGRVRTVKAISFLLSPGQCITTADLERICVVVNVVYPELLKGPIDAPRWPLIVPHGDIVVPPVVAADPDNAEINAWQQDVADVAENNPDLWRGAVSCMCACVCACEFLFCVFSELHPPNDRTCLADCQTQQHSLLPLRLHEPTAL
jgi:hypothetical protein